MVFGTGQAGQPDLRRILAHDVNRPGFVLPGSRCGLDLRQYSFANLIDRSLPPVAMRTETQLCPMDFDTVDCATGTARRRTVGVRDRGTLAVEGDDPAVRLPDVPGQFLGRDRSGSHQCRIRDRQCRHRARPVRQLGLHDAHRPLPRGRNQSARLCRYELHGESEARGRSRDVHVARPVCDRRLLLGPGPQRDRQRGVLRRR